MKFSRILEEIFPFVYYLHYTKKKQSQIDANKYCEDNSYKDYFGLSENELDLRIKEEHERAKSMDEKTFKLTLSLTIGLTILSSVTTYLISNLPIQEIIIPTSTFIFLAVFFILTAGFIALGALKTMETYGYGTKFLIDSKNESKNGIKKSYVNALILQEEMNITRHLRNESSYQCMRNGFIFLFLALLIFTSSVIANKYINTKNTKTVEKSIANTKTAVDKPKH